MATANYSPSMGSGAALQGKLNLLSRRRNAQTMGRALIRAAIPGVAIAATSVLLYKLHIIADGPIWAPAAIIGAFLLWGFRNGRLQRAGKFAAALDADYALDLDDRLSSALAFVSPTEINRRERVRDNSSRLSRFKSAVLPRYASSTLPAITSTNLVPALVDEAAVRAQALDPRRVYPVLFDRRAQILTVLAVIFVGLCFMPDYAIFQTPEARRQVAAMQKAGEKLVAVAKTIQNDGAPKPDDVQRLSRRMQKLGQKMVRGRLTKRAALTEMGELRQQLQKAQQPKSQSQSSAGPQIAEALRETPLQSEAGRKVQQNLQENKWDDAAKQLDQLADQLDSGKLSPQEKEKAASDLDKTARDLRSRGGDANKQAAQQLEDAAKQLRQPEQPKTGQQQGQNADQPKQNQQGQQNGQNQQSNPGQNGQKKQGGQQQQQDGQQGKQNQQSQQQAGHQGGQQQQKQGGQDSQGQQGQQQQQQGGKQSQQNSQGQQGQQQQQGGQQGKSGSQSGQQGQQQQSQQGSQSGQQGGSGQQQSSGQQGGGQGASDALRNMANGLRQGSSGGSGSDLRDMMNQLRDAENQTGTNGGQQSGLGKPGQGGATYGQGDFKSVTPGKDLFATDPHNAVGGGPGLGPRNNALGNNPGGGVSKLKSRRTGDKRRYEDVWSDRLPKTHAQIDRIHGKWGGSGEVEQMPTRGEAKGGQVKTPYYNVYESYKRDEEEAVGRESVPPAYKQPVKDYFESIKP